MLIKMIRKLLLILLFDNVALLSSNFGANAFSDIVIQTVYCYLGRDIVILSASEESFDGIGPFYL